LRGFRLLGFILFILVSACTSTTSKNSDPWENWNRKVFKFNKVMDESIARPITSGYKAVTPDFIETGVSNAFNNLRDIPTSFNNLLQGKPLDFLSDLSRFIVNTTLGIGGLWDPASSMNLEKHDEDFGQTLAKWGVADGPYMMIPFLGPSTLRDISAYPVDSKVDLINQIEHQLTRYEFVALELIDKRSALMQYEEQLESVSDEYSFIRDIYLQNRTYKVFDGEIPLDDNFDCEDDDEDCDF